MNIILSMCGKGKRFLEQGIHLPKFLCAYNGAPMIYHAVETLGIKGRIHFIVKQEHLIDYPYLEKCC
jgi:molybdopterin-guanine dinucleotide biosynthesis protein A